MFIRNAWYVASWADDLGDTPVARTICGEPVVLFRDREGRANALLDMCCHRGAPLSTGRVVDAGIECGYHGMIYGGDGVCVHIPGQVHIPPKARTRSFPIVEKDEMVWIWTGDPARADASKIVDYPFHSDHAKWPHKHDLYPINGNATLMIDNLMDLTHLAYVHVSTIGGSNAQQHVDAIMDTQPNENGLKYTRWMLNHTPPPTYVKAVPFKGLVDRWQEFEFVAPSCVLQWTGAVDADTGAYDKGMRDGGFSLRIFHGITPETETTCHYFWSGMNGYRQNEPQATVDLFNELTTAFRQDQWIVEQQSMRLRAYGEDKLINIVADAARVHMRRVMDRLRAAETAEVTAPA